MKILLTFLVLFFIATPAFATTTPNILWNSENGFFGNETPAQVSANMVDGARSTGLSLWPLLSFLGILIAFVIFLSVVTAINDSLAPKNAQIPRVMGKDGNYYVTDDEGGRMRYYSGDLKTPNWLINRHLNRQARHNAKFGDMPARFRDKHEIRAREKEFHDNINTMPEWLRDKNLDRNPSDLGTMPDWLRDRKQ